MSAAASTDPALRTRRLRPDAITWVLLAVVAVGGALRFGGIGWGLPLQLHADEWVVVEGAIDMAARNSFAPPFFSRPDHLETQMSYLAYQAWGHLFGGGPPEVLFAADQAPFYALARAVTAALGTASIIVAYFIGCSFRRTIGLWSAFVIAFFPPLVEHSRYATPDVPLAFGVLLTVLGTVRYLQRPNWRYLVLACLGVSLGITAKYPAVIATLTIAAAVIVAAWRARLWWQIPVRGAAAVGMVLGFTFALSPTLFTNFSAVRGQLLQQNSTGHLGADGLDWFGNASFYASTFLDNAGVLLTAFALLGLVIAIVGRRWDMTPLLTGVIFWVAISALTLHWDRWGMPMFLTPLLLAAVGFDAASRWSVERQAWIRVAVSIAGAVSALSLLLASSAQLAVALAQDTRQTAAADLADLGIDADDVFYDGYTPFRTDGPRNLASELTLVDGVVQPKQGLETLPYILTSSSMTDRYIRATNMPEEQALYSALRELPVERQWTSVGMAPASMWEPVRITQSIAFLTRVASGADVGPQLTLHRMPAAP